MTPPKRSPSKPTRTSRAVYAALNKTLKTLQLGEQDKAGEALARRLATAIDQETSGRTVAELGRAMLAVLESLGATPAARRAIVKGVQPNAATGGQSSALDELRKRRDRRAHGAAPVDATSS
ncbi:terminase small subunit [Prauserella flavalba]|uniref:terminase small subunit n=1 Tax=Prauserella flavalba TaxID=1477506 RepID=UPI0011B6719C|nr:hypothetical protein [Prauserella flavalba]